MDFLAFVFVLSGLLSALFIAWIVSMIVMVVIVHYWPSSKLGRLIDINFFDSEPVNDFNVKVGDCITNKLGGKQSATI